MAGRTVMELAGWEAFVHGVFAITITLLVLNITVPPVETTPDGAALADALVARIPEYLAYGLSFMYVGAYWIATHRSLRMARGVDHRFLVIGLLYLMSIAALPFVSALLAEYVGADQGRNRIVVIAFAGWQLVVSLLAYASLAYSRRAGLFKPAVGTAVARRWLRLALAAPVVWLVALIAALAVGVAALAVPIALLPVFLWETHPRSPGVEGQALPEA